MAFVRKILEDKWAKTKRFVGAQATRHNFIRLLAVSQAVIVVFVWVFCYSSAKSAIVFTAKYEFSELIQRRSAITNLGSDIITQAGGESDGVLGAAQAKASSVVREASSVVAEVSKAIPKPTLMANMTAENACLELLSFSECHHIKLDSAFVAAFWLLLCTATVTTATFFIGHQRVFQTLSWAAIVTGLIAIALFQGLCISTWTVAEVVSSILEERSEDANARSLYLTFTCIAIFSVAICIIIRRHRSLGNCIKCDQASVRSYSEKSSESSTGRERSFSDNSGIRVGSYSAPKRPKMTHPALRGSPIRDSIRIIYESAHGKNNSI